MNGMDIEQLETRLRRAASHLRYPPTPPLAAALTRSPRSRPARAWVWAAVTVLVVLAALLLVPPARAAILDFIQIGVVRILRTQPAPLPPGTPALEMAPTAEALPASPAQPSVTAPSAPALRDIGGETTLEEARSRTGFPILLPQYPPELGQPDRVYLQEMGGSLLFLVWLNPDGRVQMTLQEIAPGNWAMTKLGPQALQEVTVNGQHGVWATGPYLLETRNHSYVTQQLVEGNALIWAQATITYRLESSLSLDEALKVAESLQPLP